MRRLWGMNLNVKKFSLKGLKMIGSYSIYGVNTALSSCLHTENQWKLSAS
jgi:hypothetical protein